MPVSWEHDESLEHLALYLMEGLNKKHPLSVAAIRAYDDIAQDPSAYPLLVLHRTEGEGEALQRCQGMIKYILLNQADRQARPGVFRWAELAIAELLRDYEYHVPHIRIVDLDGIQSRYRIGSLQNAIFPLLEIRFSFVDWNTDIE